MSKFVTRWTEFPQDPSDFWLDILMCKFIERKHQELGDYLLKDLWMIVSSFLDYREPIEASMPLELFTFPSDNGHNPRRWVTHICGREDGKDFKIGFSGMEVQF